MIDVSYAPGGALGCTFFPEAVDVSAQFDRSALDLTLICVRPALSSQPTSFSISCCKSVSLHMVWPSAHTVQTVVFPPECISHCSAAFYLKIRMIAGARAACGAVLEPR
jgi:hypothetical protein